MSVIYVSQVHTGILGKLSDDTEISNIISVCYTSAVFSQLSVEPRFSGKSLALLLLYCTSIIAADNKLFA